MSALTIYSEDGSTAAPPLTDYNAIAETLGKLGVQFERWDADRPLSPDASQGPVPGRSALFH